MQRKSAVLGCSGLLFETHMPTNIKIISEKYNKKEPSNKSNLCKDGWRSVVVLDGCSQEGQRAPLQFSTIHKYKDKYKQNTPTKHPTGEIQRYENSLKSKGQARRLQLYFFKINILSCPKPTLGWLSKVCAALRHDCASFCCVSSRPQAIETLHGPCQLQTLPSPCIFCISTCICQT